jgi:hypothetical protein
MAMSEIKELIPPRLKHPDREIDHELTAGTVYPDDTGVAH